MIWWRLQHEIYDTSPSAPTWIDSITSYCWKGPRQYVEGMQRVSVHWQSEDGWIAAGGVVCVGCFLTWVIWDSSHGTILTLLCNLIVFATLIHRLSSPMAILLSTLTSVASDLLNDALRLDNELSAWAATCSLRSVTEVTTKASGRHIPL